LRVGHTEERARIDTDEFDEVTRGASEHQVGGENFTWPSSGGTDGTGIGPRRGCWMGPRAVIRRAQSPKPPGDGAGDDKFVDGRGVHTFDGGDEAVWEAHAPREGGGNSVVPIAGEQAADAADPIAQRGGGRAGIEDCEERDGMASRGIMSGDAPGDECEGGEPGEQAAEPRESVGAEQQVHGIREKFGRRFQ